MRTFIGFALGTLLTFGAVSSAAAAGNEPVPAEANGIEVIVVTAKRSTTPPVDARPLADVVSSAKRTAAAEARRTPAIRLELPKVELNLTALPVSRF